MMVATCWCYSVYSHNMMLLLLLQVIDDGRHLLVLQRVQSQHDVVVVVAGY